MTPETPDTQQAQQDLPRTPSYVRPLSRGVTMSEYPVTLDHDAARELAQKVQEIEEARAAAAVSGRDYLIR